MRLTRRGLLATVWATGVAACASPPGIVASGAEEDATALAARIASGQISASEAVETAIARAQAVQPKINFMVNDTFAAARAQALNPVKGPFAGVPYLIKDLNDVKGVVTRHGSRATASAKPATEQMVYTNRTFELGFICIGKSAAPEAGYLPTTEPLAFGPTRNPWDTTRSSGGSSGGAAAAVAAGVVPMAHANDGGGSIRFPAANCGLVGLKPSRGRLVDEEVNPGPLSIAVQGVVSHTVRDTAMMLSLTERKGASAIHAPVGLVMPPFNRKLRVGVITKGFAGNEADAEVKAVVNNTARTLESLGHTVTLTDWPMAQTFQDDFLAFWSLGAAADVARITKEFGVKADENNFEPFSLRMAENAAKMSEAETGAVIGRLAAATAAYNAWMKNFDVVISPVLTSPPSPLGYLRGDVPFDTLRDRLLQQVGYTLIHNVSGAPAISLPLGRTANNLPIGVQACGALGADGLLVALACQLEEAMPWRSYRTTL